MTAPVSKHLGNDPELVTAAQQGDEAAFVTLYERHAPIAWRTALALTGTIDDARAIVTESFARTFTAIRTGRVDPGTTFRTVLLTSVRNATLDRRRIEAEGSTPTPRHEYAGEDAEMIALAFGPLPERWRTALWLTEVEALRAKQISPVVGLATPATLNLIGRAHSGLTEQYLQLHVGEVNNRTCSRSVSRLGSYSSGTLSESDAAKVERHLRLCESCADRHTRVRNAGQRLRALIAPLPADLVDQARIAWAAAVATPASRTGTGLSPTVEKVLAGVSAVAAAVGVFGATMFAANDGNGGKGREAAAAPVVAESTEPIGDDDPLAGVTPVALPSPGSSGGGHGSFGTAARQGTATSPGAGVIGASDPAGNRTPAGQTDDPTDSRTDEPATGGDDDGATPGTAGSEPEVKVDTTVGDVPVAIEVDESPSATVGDVTLGSNDDTDAAAETDDDSIVEVGGALEPLAPVVDPVDEVVTGITKTLGL
jgi:DNA-directed RNA polymerase specialized sigma24 family protein